MNVNWYGKQSETKKSTRDKTINRCTESIFEEHFSAMLPMEDKSTVGEMTGTGKGSILQQLLSVIITITISLIVYSIANQH